MLDTLPRAHSDRTDQTRAQPIRGVPPSRDPLPAPPNEEMAARADMLSDPDAIQRRLAAARTRLLRLAQLQGVPADAAEDVVQETYLEAWRALDALRRPDRFDAWLDGICRNLCRRHARQAGTLAAVLRPLGSSPGAVQVTAAETGADAAGPDDVIDPLALDPAEALSRQDLTALLDRALGYLHPATRDALVLRYLAELPADEVAGRLGLTTNALDVRLHRARKQLREVLGGALRADAEACDLALDPAPVDGRQQTRIWCPLCGDDRLYAEIDRANGEARFYCASCGPRFVPGSANHIVGTWCPGLLGGVSSPKALLSRMLAAVSEQYRHGLATGSLPCRCGRPARVEPRVPEEAPEAFRRLPGLHACCPVCGIVDVTEIWRLTLDQPVTQRFWRAHPRIRVLPEVGEVEAQGRPAIVSSVVSVSGADARLDLIWARDTLDVLAVYRGPPGA
jgi:RNA polymerase sigma factor (sigma-70 family)